jgi:hypothetical protein
MKLHRCSHKEKLRQGNTFQFDYVGACFAGRGLGCQLWDGWIITGNTFHLAWRFIPHWLRYPLRKNQNQSSVYCVRMALFSKSGRNAEILLKNDPFCFDFSAERFFCPKGIHQRTPQ